jgi:hypothetical protein
MACLDDSLRVKDLQGFSLGVFGTPCRAWFIELASTLDSFCLRSAAILDQKHHGANREGKEQHPRPHDSMAEISDPQEFDGEDAKFKIMIRPVIGNLPNANNNKHNPEPFFP